MPDVDITSLSVEISAESQGAELNIDKLATAISNLRTKGNVAKVCASLNSLTNSIAALKSASSGMNGLDTVVSFLDRIENVNLSESAKGIRSVASALNRISSVDLKGLDLSGLKSKMSSLQKGLAPLSKVDASGLRSVSSALNSIAKIPNFSEKLDADTLNKFSDACEKITNALGPLASKIETVGNSFAKLPSNIQKVINVTDGTTKANNRSAKSYLSLSNQLNNFMRNMAKLVSLKAIATYLGNAAESFNSYYEAANLFGVSMKGLTDEASGFINKMETLLGIDPTEAMNNMATIQGLTTSFGMASDKAYVLSKNLTQLGYDLASLKNIPVAESFTKIQAAISGELEPIRRLGVDLSQARLQQELLNLGYSQSVSSLSQADKAVLRYIAIMKQTTDAQGDFARTLSSPANMIRILQAQLNSLARVVGSLLYPALKSILPPLIAAVELVKELVTGIASLMGVKVEFPDFSTASDAVGSVTDAMDDTTKATGKAAKAFKNYIMGFDELNVIQKNADSSGSGSGSGAAGNLLGDVDLSGYDMFKDYVGTAVDEVKEKIRSMLPVIGAVTAALALWKLTGFVSDVVEAIKQLGILKGLVAGGILVGIGFFLMFDGIKKAIEDKLNAINFTEILVGAISLVGGAALLGAKIAQFITTSFADSAVAQAITAAGGQMGGALIGAAIAGVVAGIAMFVTGVYDALNNGLNTLNGLLIPLGSTMAGAAIGAIIGSLGGPITAGIGALIGLLIGGLTDAAIAIYQNWNKIHIRLEKMSMDLKKWFVSVGEWWDEAWQGFVTNWNTAWSNLHNAIDSAKETLNAASEKVKQWFVSVGEWWDEKWAGFKTNWDKSWNSLVDTVKELPAKFLNYGKNIVEGLINGINNGIEWAKKTASGLAKAIIDKFTGDMDINSPSGVFEDYGWYIDMGLINGIISAKGMVESSMQKLADSVKAVGKELTQDNYGLGDASIAMTADGDENGLTKSARDLRNVLSNVGGDLSGWLKKIKSAFTEFSDGINAVSDVGKKISQGFSDSINALSKASKSIVAVQDSFSTAISDIRTFVNNSVAEIENSYHYAGGGINGTISATGTAIRKALEGIALGFQKISEVIDNVTSTIDNIKKVVDTFNKLKTTIGDVVEQIPALKTAFDGLGKFLGGLFDGEKGIGKAFSDGWDSILRGAGTFFDNLKIKFDKSWIDNKINEGVGTLTDFIYKAFSTNWDDILKSALTFLGNLGIDFSKFLGSGSSSGGSTGGSSSSASSGSNGGNWISAGLKATLAVIKGFSGDWVGAAGYAIGAIGDVCGDIAGWLGDIFGGIGDWVGDTVSWVGDAVGGAFDWLKGLFGFADGGFPTAGELFYARESGPEFVGSMGGHTAVANNDQIVEGIREGVADAMTQQNELLRQQNELLKALLEKESTAEISVSSMSQAISRVNQRNGKTIIPIGT